MGGDGVVSGVVGDGGGKLCQCCGAVGGGDWVSGGCCSAVFWCEGECYCALGNGEGGVTSVCFSGDCDAKGVVSWKFRCSLVDA